MEFELIQPWGDVEGDVPEVPAYVNEIAHQVMGMYDMRVSNMQLITTKPDKGGAIWKIDTDKGPRSLKALHRAPARSLFSVGAQDYLVQQGARVPALIPNREGLLYTEGGGKLWIVTDWIELTPASKVDLQGAQTLCYGLGVFHKLTQGYVPPKGAQVSSRLYTYPKHYHKIWTKMSWFRHVTQAYQDMPASKKLNTLIDQYEQQALVALYNLEYNSAYRDLIARGEVAWGLVHQDFGWSNGQEGPGGLWIIDLDGVSYDLPIRDLRKLITGTMVDLGNWDLTWIKGMIEAYNEANPIEPELYQMMLLDMALPNEFYKNVKELLYEPQLFLDEQLLTLLESMEQAEASKWAALNELGLSLQTPPADYRPNPVFMEMNRPLQESSSVGTVFATPLPAQPVAVPEPLVAAAVPVPEQPAVRFELPAIAFKQPVAVATRSAAESKRKQAESMLAKSRTSRKPTEPKPYKNEKHRDTRIGARELYNALTASQRAMPKADAKELMLKMGITPDVADRALVKPSASLTPMLQSVSLLMRVLDQKGGK